MSTESSNPIHLEMHHGVLPVDSWCSRSSGFAAGAVDTAAGTHNYTATDNRFATKTKLIMSMVSIFV